MTAHVTSCKTETTRFDDIDCSMRYNCEFTCEWALQHDRSPKSPTVYRTSDVAETGNAIRQVQRWVMPHFNERVGRPA
jgi:hypothetical protein